jgi:argininosuccinate lyase
MSEPVWRKPDSVIDARIMRFLAGEDVLLDRELLPYDIRASRAHAQGLAEIGVLSADECAALLRELGALDAAVREERFVLDARFEDGHSAIESWLTARLGDTGRKIHTGRSRNDQVLVASRLWLKDRTQALRHALAEIAHICLQRACEPALPMPGYTHLQRAVVSSTALWWAGHAESVIDSAAMARDAARLIDANPLGTAAGYGVNLPLPRERTTAALGFARMQINPIAAQLSRGKYEWQVLAALAQALGDVRRLAWDLSLFTTAEFRFVQLPAQYTTGSSLMPNKRNPDVVELLRAAAAPVHGAMTELHSLMSLPSGYQRDLQYSKSPTLRALTHGLDALAVVPGLLHGVQWDAEAMRAAIDAGMYATDIAIERARAGVPFRQAYGEAAANTHEVAGRTPEGSLAARVSPGAAVDLRLNALVDRLAALRNDA